MRALFTCGVMDVLMENGITFDGLVGVSAGAAFGCNYKSRQTGRPLRYNVRFAKDWRYCSLWSLLTTGNLFGAKFAYHTVANKYDLFDSEAFEHNPMEFHVVATDVLTGKAVYKQLERGGAYLCEWLRASSSMPIVSRVVRIDGLQLLDGGIADSIPLRYFQSQGYERNLVLLWRYPNLADAMARRHEMYNEELRYVAQEATKGNTLVVCPAEELPIGRISHDRALMVETYNIGRQTAQQQLAEIQEFCSKE